MTNLQTKVITDEWVTASWEDYIQTIENPTFEQSKGYYHNGQMRIEMASLGHDHASDNTIAILVISLFATIRNIPIKGLTNCTYRKTGVRECQPDISYYIGERIQLVPRGTNIINLDNYRAPDLAIELGKSTIADDLGRKRILYEDLAIPEYWVVDVQQAEVTAFAIANYGSRRITESQVLAGFPISLLAEALQRNLQGDQSQVVNWLLTEVQNS